MKRILIEWYDYDGKGPFRQSSTEVEELIARAVGIIRPFLRTMQVQLDVRQIRMKADERGPSGRVRINGKEVEACTDENLSVETLTDAVLKETARFTGRGCAGDPEDLYR